MTAVAVRRPRQVLAVRAAELRAEGLLLREIAVKLGISRQYAAELVDDPDGAKARAKKDSYRRPCPECGTLMNGANGRGVDAPRRCAKCAKDDPPVFWTAELIIVAFQAFHRHNGRTPSSKDAQITALSVRAQCSPERLREGDANPIQLPNPSAVKRLFGSWPNACRAAGLEPVRVGTPPGRPRRKLTPAASCRLDRPPATLGAQPKEGPVQSKPC